MSGAPPLLLPPRHCTSPPIKTEEQPVVRPATSGPVQGIVTHESRIPLRERKLPSALNAKLSYIFRPRPNKIEEFDTAVFARFPQTFRSMGLGSQIRKSWDGSLEARGAHRAMLSSKAAAAGGVISEMDGPPSAFRCRSADQSLSRALER